MVQPRRRGVLVHSRREPWVPHCPAGQAGSTRGAVGLTGMTRPIVVAIDRDLARALGREAVKIGERGECRTPSGLEVDIRARLTAAVDGTRSYPSADSPSSARRRYEDTAISVVNETTLAAVTAEVVLTHRAE